MKDCNFAYIITMKQWLKRSQSPNTSRGQRLPSPSREFRQVITRLTQGYAPGHFLAYCLVSKESSYGIFLNERLLALDTQARQLRYYSHIPQLPLTHPRDLPAPKEVIPIRTGIEFQLQKVRIGHVSIRWQENRQWRLWKIIMGSNQIAKEFYALFSHVLAAEAEKARINLVPIPKEYKISQAESLASPNRQAITPAPFKSQQRVKEYPSANNATYSLSATPASKRLSFSDSSKQSVINQSSSQRLNISLYDTNRQRDQQNELFSSNFKGLEISPSPQRQSEENSLQKTGLISAGWIKAKNGTQKAVVYSTFLKICRRKVELMMENFMATHLMHQQYNQFHLIRDNDIEIYYTPLIDSTQEELSSIFFTNLRQQECMLEQWECLNYLSKFEHARGSRILVPMACVLTHKAFRFYCKNSLEMYPHKRKIMPSQYQEQLDSLEEDSHLKVRNGNEQIYLIEEGGEHLLYLDHTSCLPKISPHFSVPPSYIELFLTRGVVLNDKDLQAIADHIKSKLVRKIQDNLYQRSFSTSCEVMEYINNSGLSSTFLPLFLTQHSQLYDHVGRLIASEVVACAAEWQIRRRMQVQFFKKRQFGFAINQVRSSVGLLLQQDSYIINTISEISKNMFNFVLPSPLSHFIDPQAMTISLFNRLALDCRGVFSDTPQAQQAWSHKYINDYIEITPLVNAAVMRYESFSINHHLLYTLIEDINYQINTKITLDQVLNVLGLRKQSSGLYITTPNYTILPTALKRKVNYYLSHFIAPSFEPAPQQSLQSCIYGDSFTHQSPHPHYYTHTIQHLVTLNKIRWLARMKYLPKVDDLLEKEVEQAATWNQLHLLIQIYAFAGKLKLRQGEVSNALQCSLKAMQYALLQYEKEPTILVQLVIAEQAFEAANLHFNAHKFTKALDLYSTVQDILAKIKTSSDHISLNPEFLSLYVNKCSIHLLFGDYAECLQQCLASLQSCSRLINQMQSNECVEHEFKIYQVLFRCYQIKNMRRELVEVACICCQKYFEDFVFANRHPNTQILSGILKMLWISVIKQIQSLSTTRTSDLNHSAKLKTIYLKKVRKELKNLRENLGDQHRYVQEQAVTYFSRKIFKYEQPVQDCRMLIGVIDCLSEVTLNSRSLHSSKLYDKESLQNQWLALEMMAVLVGFDFLVGCIDEYLRIYDFNL